MQISSRFTIAIHTMLCIAYFKDKCKITSKFISSSVNVNPVIIRRVLGQLKDANLVSIEAGVGGANLIKDLKDITMLDVFKAVNCTKDNIFSFHEHPCVKCPVGHEIHKVLDKHLEGIQDSMYKYMENVNLEMLCSDMNKFIVEDKL